jgi:hypothetical protein
MAEGHHYVPRFQREGFRHKNVATDPGYYSFVDQNCQRHDDIQQGWSAARLPHSSRMHGKL